MSTYELFLAMSKHLSIALTTEIPHLRNSLTVFGFFLLGLHSDNYLWATRTSFLLLIFLDVRPPEACL